MDAANSSPLITGTESCLASHRLLNQQRHPGFLGQMQHQEQDCHCLLPAHSERCLQYYSSQKGHPKDTCAPLQACLELHTPAGSQQMGSHLLLQTCLETMLHSSSGIIQDGHPCSMSLWRGGELCGVLGGPPHHVRGVHGHVLQNTLDVNCYCM